jgi:hypothetical protein
MSEIVYYLPGWGGRLNTGLGQGLMDRGFDVSGRETREQFRDLLFLEQVQLVANDLQNYFWTPESKVEGICWAQTTLADYSKSG